MGFPWKVLGPVQQFQPLQRGGVHCFQELAKSHRLEMKITHTANRHGKTRTTQGEFQQRSRCHDGQVRPFLEKIPERLQRVGRGLDFIQKNERASPRAPASNCLQIGKNRAHIQPGKNRIQIPMPLQIDLQQVQALIFGEQADQCGFSHLPRTSQNKGFPCFRGVPFFQCGGGFSLHLIHKYHWCFVISNSKNQ